MLSESLTNKWKFFELCDVWQVKNPDSRKFTWSRHKPKISCSRIDYFLISECALNLISECTIQPSIMTDHALITLSIDNKEDCRGPGLWRLNNKVLDCDEYVYQMCNMIMGLKRVYEQSYPLDLWELLQRKCSDFSKTYCKKRAKKRKVYIWCNREAASLNT